MIKICDIICPKGGFVRAIRILEDFFNPELSKAKLLSYFPNPEARNAFYKIAKSLHPTSKDRAFIVSGTFGSGKSHFGLVIANYLTKNSSDSDFEYVWKRIEEKDPTKANEIHLARNTDDKYLIVLIEGYDSDGIEHALLKGLRDALVDSRRGDLSADLLKTSYYSAKQKMKNWKEVKPEFYEELRYILEKEDEDIETFTEKLDQFDEPALNKFKDAHREITTTEFEPLIGYKKVPEVYKEVCIEIREKGFKGIAVIWDQFNDHLEHRRSSELGIDVGSLRELAESVERSGENSLLLIIISHNLPRSYLRGKISDESLENWITTEGRFEQLPFKAIEESEELMSYIITKDTHGAIWREIEEIIQKDTEIQDNIIELDLFPNKPKEWILETVLKGLYPLHPFAGYLLPRISDVVGQEARTLFTFFADEDEGGFKRFINQKGIFKPDKTLNYYYADMLFDFFKEPINSNIRTLRIMSDYREALGKVKDPNDWLTQRILRILAIIDTVKIENPSIPLFKVPSHLATILDERENEISSLLEALKSADILWLRSSGEFDFKRRGVEYNLQRDLERERGTLDWDNPIRYLSSLYPPDDHEANQYEKKYHVRRKLVGKYILPDGLSNASKYENEIQNQYIDGYLLYVIAETEKDIEYSRRFAINIKNKQITIAIPRRPVDIFSRLKTIKALRNLEDKPPYDRRDTQQNVELKEYLEKEEKIIDKELGFFRSIDSVEIFRNGETVDTSKFQNLSDFASLVMQKVFDKVPIIKHNVTANIEVRDRKKERQDLVTEILAVPRKKIAFVTTGGRVPAKMTVLKQTFEDNDMLESKKEGDSEFFDIKEPTSGNSKEFWDVMCNFLKRDVSDFPGLVKTLRSPPYGASPRAMELFLAAFFRIFRPYFKIKVRGNTEAFNGETIYNIVNNYVDKTEILYRKLHPKEEEYLNLVYKVIEPSSDILSFSSLDDVANKLIDWFNSLPNVTKYSQDIGEEGREFIESMMECDKENMSNAIFDIIPRALSLPIPITNWNSEDLDVFEKGFQQVVEGLSNYPDEVKDKIREMLKAVFGASTSLNHDIMPKINHWYFDLPPDLKQKTKGLTQDENVLLKYAKEQDLQRFEDIYFEEMPKALKIGSYLDWKNLTDRTSEYRTKLEDAKKKIENKRKYVTTHKKPQEKKKEEKKRPRLSQKAKNLDNTIRKKIKSIDKWEVIEILEKILEELKK